MMNDTYNMSEIDLEIDSIDDVEEFYILGLPVKTDIGYCHFLKVKDYPKLYNDLQIFSLTKWHYVHKLMELNKDNKEAERLKDLTLAQIVHSIDEIRRVYEKVFAHFFQDVNAFSKIQTEQEFDYYRGLILKLSCIKEEEVNPNPEIQKWIEKSRRVKSQQGEKMSFADIVTSVSALKGISYEEINEMTLYQLYMDFYRIASKIDYDTGTLFATVSTEEVKIEGWNKHIDMFEKEKHGLTREEFSKVAGVVND